MDLLGCTLVLFAEAGLIEETKSAFGGRLRNVDAEIEMTSLDFENKLKERCELATPWECHVEVKLRLAKL